MMRIVAVEILAVLLASAPTPGALQHAIAGCKVDQTRTLLEAGADPDADVSWLASGRSCSDDDALAVAKLLESHGSKFEAPRLLVNLAPRRLPKTLAFLAAKHGTGDPTAALHAIARDGDLDSIRVLLDAGADPTDGVAKSSALMDATFGRHADAVAEMLKHVSAKQSPKVLAAWDAAVRENDADVMHAFTAAGAARPAASPTPTPCFATPLTPDDQALLARLGLPNSRKLAGLAGSPECKRIAECGDLLLVDCNSAADGPAYYLDRKAESLVSTCGGACMLHCTDCPPKQWTCGCGR